MLIFGHKLIKTQKFKKIKDEKDLEKESINYFIYNEKLLELCLKNKVDFAIQAQNEDEILFSNALGASFIVLDDENLAIKASKMAEFYLFDSKILLQISKLEQLEKAYKLGVDGVITKEFLKTQ